MIFITAYPERFLTGERPEPAFLIAKPFQPVDGVGDREPGAVLRAQRQAPRAPHRGVLTDRAGSCAYDTRAPAAAEVPAAAARLGNVSSRS